MASLQSYQSHGNRYYRIVESFRKDGKPHIRVLAHLGRVEDILQLHAQERSSIKVGSVSAGAVAAIHHLAEELDIAEKINGSLKKRTGAVPKRNGLTVGESLLAGIIGRVCAPRSKRAFADWAQTTCLPEQMGFVATELTSQHFWDQMHALPVEILAEIEQQIVAEVIRIEQLQVQALAYDTTNFYTHIASTNHRPQLPQRGHNKQHRDDLRQLGLALVVDQTTQLPLGHVLYEGARSDMKTFWAFLKPVRERLHSYTAEPEQLTLVFDAGASSNRNLQNLEQHQDHYVTAVPPYLYPDLLAEASEQLTPVLLSSGAMVSAWRTRYKLMGKERDVVVVFSEQLYEGQLRGLHQQLACWSKQAEEIGTQPRGTVASVSQRLAKICNRQYLRNLVHYEVSDQGDGRVQVRTWCEMAEYRRLTTKHFGLRILITDREQWTLAQVIEAYRGQSKVESAFRNLKDPGMLAIHPQFHWTDQKLHVHAFMCVIGYLLGTLLCWRARRDVGFTGNSHTLLNELTKIRICRIVDQTGRAGRPRVRQQLEEMTDQLRRLADLLHAEPKLT